jgi:excisionase family DNA binding protein
MMDDTWFTAEEIADYLNITRDTVYKWITTRNMPAHKIGRVWIFSMQEITQWVSSIGAKEGETDITEKGMPQWRMTVRCNPHLDRRLNITWNWQT